MPTTITANAEIKRCFQRLKNDRNYVVYKKSKARRNKFAAQDLKEETKLQRQAANIKAHNKIYKQLDDGRFVKRKKMPAGLAASQKRNKRKAVKKAAKKQATVRKSNRLKATTAAAGGGKDKFFK